jgi:NAD(P)-dependent dehydrogenase (short-subunit alcohol dehydrogenase family)
MTAAATFAGRVAVVTGGGSGIGLAIARAFAVAGATVVIAGRDGARLASAAEPIGAEAVPTDVTREEDVAALFGRVGERHGRLDVLVNNAEDLDLGAWDETMAINVRGLITCIKHAVPLLKRTPGSSIVNMSSLMGLRGYPMRSAYTASKFAVIGITEAVAQELGPHGIRVNALCPGAVHGDLMKRVIASRSAAEGRMPEEIIKVNYTDKAALRRWVEPEEVAAVALFLAGPGAASVTGDRIRIDAGRM